MRVPGRGGGRNGNFNRSAGRSEGRGSYHTKNKTFTSKEGGSAKHPKFHPINYRNTSQPTFYQVQEALVYHISTSNEVRGTWVNDIAESIEEMEMKNLEEDMPVRPPDPLMPQAPTEEGAVDTMEWQAILQARNARIATIQEVHSQQTKEWVRRKDYFDANKKIVFTIIMKDFVSDTMTAKIKGHPRYIDELKRSKDPVQLLELIDVLMHNTTTTVYPIRAMFETLKNLIDLTQREEDSLQDYIGRMRSCCRQAKAVLGPKFLDFFAENTAEYKALSSQYERQAMKDSMLERAFAYLLFNNSLNRKYGLLVKGVHTQYTLEHNQYPKTFTRATEVLNNHVWDKPPESSKPIPKEKGYNKNTSSGTVTKRSTSTEGVSATSFSQTTTPIICYACGEPNHKAPQCTNPIAQRPRAEWKYPNGIPRSARQNRQHDTNDGTQSQAGSSLSTQDRSTQGQSRPNIWSGTGFSSNCEVCFDMRQQDIPQRILDHLKMEICLDSGSGENTMANPDYVCNQREGTRPINMLTNAGHKQMNTIADVPGFDRAYYDPTNITNIFSLAKVVDKYPVEFNSWKDDAFYIYPKGDPSCKADAIRIPRSKNNVYTWEPEIPDGDIFEDELPGLVPVHNDAIIPTVANNSLPFTKRQKEDASRARKLQVTCCLPTTVNLKKLIKMNAIMNCPVTSQDIDRAEKMFGSDNPMAMGKWTRRKPSARPIDVVEIPPEILMENHNLELCFDLMYISKCTFFTAIDRSVKYRSAVPLDSRDANELFRGLEVVIRHYNQAGFMITNGHCDREFTCLYDDAADQLHMRLTFVGAGDHQPEAERNNRTIQERQRAITQMLPFSTMPRIMIIHSTLDCTKKLNIFPVQGGISPYYSPHVILGGEKIDYKKHLLHPFGTFVLASEDQSPSNTPKTRAIEGVYLRAPTRRDNSHTVMNIHTGQAVARRYVEARPYPASVIDLIIKRAQREGIKDIQYRNKHGDVTYPADWIEGVDYDGGEPFENPEDYETDNSEDHQDDEASMSEDDDQEDIDPEELDNLVGDTTNPMIPKEETPEDKENEDLQVRFDDVEDNRFKVNEEDNNEDDSASEENTRYPRRVQTERKIFDPSAKPNTLNLEQLMYCHNICTQVPPNPDKHYTYDTEDALIMGKFMSEMHEAIELYDVSYGQQYMLHKGLKFFGAKGHEAVRKEMNQLDKRTCFKPICVKDLSPSERKKCLQSLTLLTEKKDGTVKGRTVADGRSQRAHTTREESASPTACLESLMCCAVIDAKERRDVMSCDIPNAFIQSELPEVKPGEDRIILKVTGLLVDIMVELNPDYYGPYVVLENGKRVLYLQILRALYGMLQASLLWYKKFRKDLESKGYVFNPYDPCVCNKMIDGKQHTVRFHVDDAKCSHVSAKVNDDFKQWLNDMYGKFGDITSTRGKIHDFLGMIFDYSEDEVVKIDMQRYVCDMIDGLSIPVVGTEMTPAANDLLKASSGTKLPKERAEEFHTVVAKGLFVCKRARPDIQPTVAVLCSRVKEPRQSDWNNLIRLLKYLNGRRKDVLILSADNLQSIKWWVDASFAVHPDFKSHTGAVMSMGRGSIQAMSQKQKLNTRSSTEAELVGADDAAGKILWTKLFLEAQGYPIVDNILHQDNQSAMKLEQNGKASSTKRTRALNIRYFFLTDQIEKGILRILYCPTGEMIADFMSKPLQGALFEKFRSSIMGHSPM